MIQITPEQEAIVGRGLSMLPLDCRDDAQKYVQDRLRPVRDIRDSDVRSAVGAAVAKYGTPMAAAFAAAGRVP